MSAPINWGQLVAPLTSVHTAPAKVPGVPPLSADQAAVYRNQFIQMILQQVVLALTNLLLPGAAGPQLTQFANNISTSFGGLGSLFGLSPTALLGTLNPVTIWTNVITTFINPLGLLAPLTGGLIPTQLLGGIPAALLSGLNTPNLLLNGLFSNGLTNWNIGSFPFSLLTGTGIGGGNSLQTTANSTTQQAAGQLIPVVPGQLVNLSGFTQYTSLASTSAAAPIELLLGLYDSAQALLSTVSIGSIAPSTTGSSSGFLSLTGSVFTVPSGTSYVAPILGVNSSATGGNVLFSGINLFKSGAVPDVLLPGLGTLRDAIVQGLGGAGTGHTISDVLSFLGAIPANNVLGIAGISGLGSTMQGTWDQLYQAFSAITGSNTPLSLLADSAHGTSNTASNALNQTVMNSGMLTGFLTARAPNHGLDPTAVASYNLASNSNTPLNATSIVAPMSFHIITQPTTFGNFETVATKSGTVTGFYLNAYRMNATGLLTSVYNSADLSSQLVTTSPGGWVQTGAIPAVNQPAFVAGEVLALESIVVGSGSVALRSQSTGVPNHPTALLQNFAASRNPTGALTPATIAAGAVAYSANQPWHSATVLAVPPGWQPPTTATFLAGHGTYTYNIPSWAQVAGAKIDLIAVGSGKGGEGEYGTAFPSQGGNPGVFATFRAIYGTDIPLGTTQLTVVVAQGGAGVTSFFAEGGNGASTTISVAGGGATLLTAAGGTANAGTVGTGPGPVGTSGNNETFHGYTAFGGTAVGSNANGSPPGGGGGGAFPYSTTSGHGADGGAWITASQP